jgi:chitinase
MTTLLGRAEASATAETEAPKPQTTSGAAATGPAANLAPTVTILEPPNDSLFELPALVFLSADATDSDGRVVRVDYSLDGQLIGSATEAP